MLSQSEKAPHITDTLRLLYTKLDLNGLPCNVRIHSSTDLSARIRVPESTYILLDNWQYGRFVAKVNSYKKTFGKIVYVDTSDHPVSLMKVVIMKKLSPMQGGTYSPSTPGGILVKPQRSLQCPIVVLSTDFTANRIYTDSQFSLTYFRPLES